MSAIVDATAETKKDEPLHINVKDLVFNYPGREPILRSLNMQLTNGARCLLIGANGAGKSSLLRILAGRYGDHFFFSVLINKLHIFLFLGI